MQKIVECVPNFSEGRDRSIIEAIAAEVSSTENILLLDVDPGKATNRTVFTFIGSPEGVKEAAFKAIKKASELIDMQKQTGEHPRIGAADVVPFVPVSGVTMEDCVQLAHDLGQRV
ncbi:MAG TPA: glutamate formimidoyltransferase, partial [Bacteroidetes bacterium]|nr:glutamate formimidoyltransferase [Bacteroidota bacterium]